MSWACARFMEPFLRPPTLLLRLPTALLLLLPQKDRALFPGADPREFWERAQDRNRATAQLYDRQAFWCCCCSRHPRTTRSLGGLSLCCRRPCSSRGGSLGQAVEPVVHLTACRLLP